MNRFFISFCLLFLFFSFGLPSGNISIIELKQVQLPPGFKISVYANDVPNARSMVLGSQGTLFVGNRSGDKVYALVDEDGDFKADKKLVIAKGLNMPNGVAFKDGDLYVAEVDKIWRFPNIENQLESPPQPQLISDAFPSDRHHGWKYIAFGPDGKLYVPVGAPCNVCEKENEIYSTVCRMNADGSDLEVYAHGVRNSVGLNWHPITQELWFTDNGRDHLGDNLPFDELNRAPEKGMHFGFPYCHQGEISDPKFGQGKSCASYTKPAKNLGPHVAALGFLFYQGDMFPKEYRHQILIAEHGSWNRSEPIGYRISLVNVKDHREAYQYSTFAEGWLQGNKPWGRPVDLLELPDGSVLVSDDYGNAIYRISYEPKKTPY